MALENIDLDTLYTSQQQKHEFVKARIQAHYRIKRLERCGVTLAKVRYISCILLSFSFVLTGFCGRPTGWHGESGLVSSGGHITVDFYKERWVYYTTHHVYRTDDAYRKRSAALVYPCSLIHFLARPLNSQRT